MKIFKKSLSIVAMACFSASATAGITSWMDGGSSNSNTTKTNQPTSQVETPPTSQVAPPTTQVTLQQITPKTNPVRTMPVNPGANNRVVTAPPPQSSHTYPQENSQGGFNPSASDLQNEKLLIQYMARVQGITSSADVLALGSEDYLAAVMLNGALVQAGMEYLTGDESPTTQGMYNKAIGCINTRNKADLTRVAQGIIAKHTRITNITKTINTGPRLSSVYKTACK